ncbi:MAG: aminotransferase class V-fold PLP-dependent enzyme [Alphaproteobacteria bacterium]|nr:aminotransferase class V-fold PLP-dependent enzyme [Alphaproteobacteria bacterium]
MIGRDAFFAPEARYFLSHSVGLMPRAAASALEDGFLSPWREAKADAWRDWLAAIEAFRRSLAPVIGARPSDICPQTNISGALSKILFSLPERARRKKIALTEDDFPTVGFVLAQARRIGYELVFLPGGARLADIDAWAPAFHDDVQLVLATHVFSNSGVKAPVREIAERARRRGVFSVLDIAQSAGAVPVDLEAFAPDFAIGTSVKYLCGGPGAAFLWTPAETAARCSPIDVGWFSHADPFEFDIHNFRYAEGAARYWGGTPSVAPFAAAAAGAGVIARAGVDAIFERNQALFTRFVDAMPAARFRSHTKQGERGSSVIVAVRSPAEASDALARARILHDMRQGGVRLSFHLYNTEEEVDALIEAIAPLT